MTKEQRLVHEKLSKSLPSRTVCVCMDVPLHIKLRSERLKKAVIGNGVRYGSLQDAARALGVNPSTINWRLKNKKPGWSYE